MSGDIFTTWAKASNNDMRKAKRNILVFLDNATSHVNALKLTNVTFNFFPPGTTSKLQPLDLGIIRAFKARYRKRLMSHLLAKLDFVQNATEMTKCVTVLDCVYWISASWNETTDITVKTCFMQAGFPFVEPSTKMYPDEEIGDDDDDIPLALLRLTNIDLATAADIEDEFEIEDNSSDWETTLLESVKGVDRSDSDDESETEDESNNETDLCYGDVLDLIYKIEKIAKKEDDRYLPHLAEIKRITEDSIILKKAASTQKTISDFFQPM
ncbi:tigger transposable element-derived protein 6-like [Pecten maximus]|uniref:tigger transposable element-derived protein 6-like n=1 Tax=Pecten maximus TaxID=6579 RepID=UPI001458458D|nr:tigger transposable element-derived protein 6-like [Pecten maximus]